MSETREIQKSVVVETSPEMAFEALTRASELREWFADEAWTQPRIDGRYDLRWVQGYRTDGRFVEIDPPRRAVVSWHGTREPGPTRVEFDLGPREDQVAVTVIHSGFGCDAVWDEALAQADKGWTRGLPNLKSTLETGVDLRLVRRPFLGINFDVLDAERSAREGIAVEEGIYVLSAVEGSAAHAVGLSKGDVIVRFAGQHTRSYQDLGAALATHEAGDVVQLDLVRGQERETVWVTLGKRPQVDVPPTAHELADQLAALYAPALDDLEAALSRATEEEAEQSPAEGEWSAKQVLAHLSSGDRGFSTILGYWAVNGWIEAEGYNPDAFPGQLEAVLVVTPTLDELLERYRLDVDELIASVRYLPETTVAHKARFRRLAQALLYLPDHTQQHVQQIRDALAAARA
jgi:uncharacterized protein YndB with AHSA1/START domain/uncharacterized damage-inducible protein DinB